MTPTAVTAIVSVLGEVVLAFHADLLRAPSTFEAFEPLGFGDDKGQAARAGFVAGHGSDDEHIAVRAIGDERPGAIDDVLALDESRCRLDVLKVASGAGFGHGDRADQLIAGEPRKPAASLCVGAIDVEIVRDDRAVDAVGKRVVSDPGLLVKDDRFVSGGAPSAAVLLGKTDA